MKTALCIDSLLFRDETIFLLELVLNLFPDSQIYTIAHRMGGILGPIESRPIVSSYLSHRSKDLNVIKKNFWLLPTAVKGIPFDESVEKVIVLSRGFIHGLNFPSTVKSYLYLLDWDLVDQKKLGWQNLFSPYVNDWKEKSLTKYKKISVSSETLKQKIQLPNADVIQPTFRTAEYPFVKDVDHNFLFEHHLVYTRGLSLDAFRSVVKVLISGGEIIRVIGPDAHLKDAKEEFPQIDFVGDHCEATCAMYSHQAKVIWDLSQSFFPATAFGALCTGRPVVVLDHPINRESLPSGAYFLPSFDQQVLRHIYHTIENSYLSFDRNALRRLGLRWNERLFKSRMAKFLDKNLS